MSAPAQVTEAHLRLANQLVSLPPSPLVLATLIADSEARACAELRADRDYNHECINRLATATGTLGEKSERVVEVALSTIDQLRAEVERLRDGGVQRIKDAMAVVMDERDSFRARAERAEDEVDAQCLLNAKGSEREAVLLRRVDRMAKECLNLRADLDAIKAIRDEETARAERAEAELAGIRALANRRNKRDHSQDTTHQLVAALDQALDIAQAELATERARIADLVADLNDACITLTSAEEDCDDYAMQNTRFKLTAVREVLLQHIPNAATKEETK